MTRARVDWTLWCHYGSAYGRDVLVARWRRLQVFALTLVDAETRPRLRLSARDLDDDTAPAARPERTFLAQRIAELADPVTGELLDLRALLRSAGFAGAPVEAALQPDLRHWRTLAHGLRFDGPGGGLAGWAFHVPAAFRRALDLQPITDAAARDTSGRTLGSQGWPPAYKFAIGDRLYDRVEARTLRWRDALTVLSEVVGVVDATESVWTAADGVVPGRLTFARRRVADGQLGALERVETTQAGFAHYLRTHRLPD